MRITGKTADNARRPSEVTHGRENRGKKRYDAQGEVSEEVKEE